MEASETDGASEAGGTTRRSEAASGALPTVQVDISPAYDLLHSFSAVVRAETQGPWHDWTRETVDALTVARQRTMQRYSLADAYQALIPVLPAPHTITTFLSTLAAMAPADFLRVAVTVDYTAPETPLAAADLLALSGNRARTRLFVERYLRLSPRHRSNVFHILDDPLRAQRELSETLEWYAEGPFAALEPHLRNERERAGERLREIVAAHAGEWPRWLAQRELLPLHVRLTGFSPVVLAPVAFLRHGRGTYYHEIQHPLFDNTEYEPLILSLASDAVLAPDPLRRRGRGARGRDTGEDVLAMLPSEQRVAAIFAALADPSRLRLVRLLAERPHYGQELATALGMSAATVSHHTSVLMKANLVTIERQAHRTYYVLGREQLMVQLHEGERFALGDGSDAPAAELPPRVEQS